jgi:hypothetical protein
MKVYENILKVSKQVKVPKINLFTKNPDSLLNRKNHSP